MLRNVNILSVVLGSIVGLLVLSAGRTAWAVDPKGNLSGIWVDDFGNEFMIAQRGNRRVSVKYLTDKGNLIWHAAHGQGVKQGNQWILNLNLHLKSGGTKPRRGAVVVGQGIVRWPAGNKWTLIATQQMQIAELSRLLAESQAESIRLSTELVALQAKLQEKEALNRQLDQALSQSAADVTKLRAQLARLEADYRNDVSRLEQEYAQLEGEFARLLNSAAITGQQKQLVADALGKVTDLADKVGIANPFAAVKKLF